MQHMERHLSLAGQLHPDAAAEALTFEDLFADHHERLYRALYLIVGNRHEAEELMQDAFVKALERWDRIDNPAGLPLSVGPQLDAEPVPAAAIGRYPDPERWGVRGPVRRRRPSRSGRALAPSAPERQRTALVLLDLLDLRSEEAAKVLRVTPATVRSLASHARTALKLSMEARDDE